MANSVLEKIAARLGRSMVAEAERERRFTQLKQGAEDIVPPAMTDEPQAFFRLQAEKNLFEICDVADLRDAVAAFQTELPLALSPQQSIQALPWREYGFTLTDDVTAPVLGVIEATAGIAETGTVVIGSTDTPSRLLFLAEELLVILRKEAIVGVQDELWEKIGPIKQRVLHLISGPSRTADVEQTLQVGAHGPRRVYLWLV